MLKSRAILAVLAASPGFRQSRSWFQTALWSDRQPEQAKASLRSALADIRRHLGPLASALRSDHFEVSLDPDMIRLTPKDETADAARFLVGFDVPNAEGFEDWLRQQRNLQPATAIKAPEPETVRPDASLDLQQATQSRIFLAASADTPASVSRMQCDALVDCIAKSTEDLGLASTIDGRGRGNTIDAFRNLASNASCDLILISESVENAVSSVNRLKVLHTDSGTLIWSKSLVGDPTLDLEHPANVSIVADFVEILTERLARDLNWSAAPLSPEMTAIAGMNHIFKLGPQNFRTADMLLKRSHFEKPHGCTLAWRAFLKTFLLAEPGHRDANDIIQEGISMARQSVEIAPQNSMVLALSAHVHVMLRDDHNIALDLSARALAINRCNPIAWACLGRAASFLGDHDRGHYLAKYGASLANATKYGYLIDSWASSTGLLAQDIVSARAFCESSHAKAMSFAPPLRFLSAIYCAEGKFDQAHATVQKLQEQEPDFTLKSLLDEGYPSKTLKRANILDAIPTNEL